MGLMQQNQMALYTELHHIQCDMQLGDQSYAYSII